MVAESRQCWNTDEELLLQLMCLLAGSCLARYLYLRRWRDLSIIPAARWGCHGIIWVLLLLPALNTRSLHLM